MSGDIVVDVLKTLAARLGYAQDCCPLVPKLPLIGLVGREPDEIQNYVNLVAPTKDGLGLAGEWDDPHTADDPSRGPHPDVKRRWRDFRTAAGRRPVKDFFDELSDADAAAVVAAMKEVQQLGLAAARHVRGDIYEVRADVSRPVCDRGPPRSDPPFA